MDQSGIHDVLHESDIINNNHDDLHSMIIKLQAETEEMNNQLEEFTLSNGNNQTTTENLGYMCQKYEDVLLNLKIQQEALKNAFKEMESIQKKQENEESFRVHFQSMSEIRLELEMIKEKQMAQKESIDSLRNQQNITSNSIQKLCVELTVLKEKHVNTFDRDDVVYSEDFNNHKNKMEKDFEAINVELAGIKKKQDTQEKFNQEVIKEFNATQREMAALGKRDTEEKNKNLVPIEREIVGIWKPSSLQEYKHYVKDGDEIKRSQWLAGRLLYSLKMNQLTWKLIVVTDEIQDVVSEATLTLGKETKYSDHTETWTFENNHLVAVFRNKGDKTVIKKYFQFFFEGKLHIVYHDSVNDVTSTRIYERVI